MSVFLARYSTCFRSRHRAFLALTSRALASASTSSAAATPTESIADTSKSSSTAKTRKKKGPRKLTTKDELSEKGEPRRNLLEDTKLEEYLEHIASSSQQITLVDLERCKPSGHAPPRTPEYEQQYNALLETLVRSFSASQLHQFLRLYNLNSPSKRTKWNLASQIIEKQWEWPSLVSINKERKDWTEVVTKSFPLDPRQSFLVLGKDGADLLALSLEHNVHVSFSVNPLSLRVEGLRGSINNLTRHIEEFKSNIKEQEFKLPSGGIVEQDTLQRISRLSGVYTENVGLGVIRLSYKASEDRAAHFAKRLAMQSVFEVTGGRILVHSPKHGLVSSIPASISPVSTYFLYPFLSPTSLLRMTGTGGLFRLRCTGERLGSKLIEETQNNVGLAHGGPTINLFGNQVNLRDTLLRQIYPGDNYFNPKTKITASFGHLLTFSATQQSSITPPWKGRQELSNVLDWLGNSKIHRFFVPCIPLPVLNLLPKQQNLVHRLTYHSVPDENAPLEDLTPLKMLKFEFDLELPKVLSRAEGQEHGESSSLLQPNNSVTESSTHHDTHTLEPKCWVGSFQELDLMMPDHPVDIRFSVTNLSAIPQDIWPEALQSYCKKLSSLVFAEQNNHQSDTPLLLTHESVNYRLVASSTVRQSSESRHSPDDNSVYTTTENILDIESNQRSRTCQITCGDVTSDESWSSLLARCDTLSAPLFRKSVIKKDISLDGIALDN